MLTLLYLATIVAQRADFFCLGERLGAGSSGTGFRGSQHYATLLITLVTVFTGHSNQTIHWSLLFAYIFLHDFPQESWKQCHAQTVRAKKLKLF